MIRQFFLVLDPDTRYQQYNCSSKHLSGHDWRPLESRVLTLSDRLFYNCGGKISAPLYFAKNVTCGVARLSAIMQEWRVH
jgi:hypothetical protein